MIISFHSGQGDERLFDSYLCLFGHYWTILQLNELHKLDKLYQLSEAGNFGKSFYFSIECFCVIMRAWRLTALLVIRSGESTNVHVPANLDTHPSVCTIEMFLEQALTGYEVKLKRPEVEDRTIITSTP